MSIIVNTREMEYIPEETMTQLLKRMKYMFPLVVVKIDGVVIPRVEFPETTFPDGVNIEIIHLISGG